MDKAVEKFSTPLNGNEVLEAVPHKQHCHPMVVNMQECELVLLFKLWKISVRSPKHERKIKDETFFRHKRTVSTHS